MLQASVKSKECLIAWAAGLVEGEGCFTRHGNTFMFLLDSTDKDVLENFKIVFPYVNLRGPYVNKNRPHNKPRYRIDAHGPKAVLIGKTILPYLCSRRSSKFLELLDIYNQYNKKA